LFPSEHSQNLNRHGGRNDGDGVPVQCGRRELQEVLVLRVPLDRLCLKRHKQWGRREHLFHVITEGLEEGDADTYWCGVNRATSVPQALVNTSPPPLPTWAEVRGAQPLLLRSEAMAWDWLPRGARNA
ncbi:hypothetical protein GH733_011693, partial [Mirounga leonina]